METTLLSIIIGSFCVYLVLAWWHVTIVCGPPPENGIHHTKIDLEVNWRINRPPILWGRPWLSFIVQNHLFFYWFASVLGVIFVYLKSASWSTALLSAIVFLILLFVLTKTIQTIVVARVKRY